ncbi:hypothetical protein BDC45DRAFT_571619 [Circinella umbellata]|nr:hypothetical protein BDC45DRAFT_571619 [Circinella umbellata]
MDDNNNGSSEQDQLDTAKDEIVAHQLHLNQCTSANVSRNASIDNIFEMNQYHPINVATTNWFDIQETTLPFLNNTSADNNKIGMISANTLHRALDVKQARYDLAVSEIKFASSNANSNHVTESDIGLRWLDVE